MLDKDLQRECRKQAIKTVAENRKITQKNVKEVLEGKTYNLNNFHLTIKYAVQNWTVEYYNREMQHRYLQPT